MPDLTLMAPGLGGRFHDILIVALADGGARAVARRADFEQAQVERALRDFFPNRAVEVKEDDGLWLAAIPAPEVI